MYTRDRATFETFPDFASSQPIAHEFSNDVARIIKTVDVDDRLADQNLIYRTDLVEMDNGIRYLVTHNTIEPTRMAARDAADRQYPGSDIAILEGTAWVTKSGKFYRDRHTMLALDHHRPTILVGVQQNLDRYNNLYKTTDDMLAIHAFYAAVLGYDQDYLTTMGTSRGGMLALLLQKRASKYGKRVLHSDSMVPCIPTPLDTLRMFAPGNIIRLARNEADAAKELELGLDEAWGLRDTIDILTPRGFVQQAKEGIALGFSNIAHAVRKSSHDDDAGDITVQKGDRMSFAEKWPHIYRNHPNMRVDVRDGGGHASSVGKRYFRETAVRQEAVAGTLHADPANRRLGGHALRHMIDIYDKQHHQATA